MQNVVERICFGYDKFFPKDNKRPPKFRAGFKYKSYTLKQTGYKFLNGNRIELVFGVHGRVKRVFKYFKHRDFDVHRVKTVTIKRDRVGDIWLCITAQFDTKSNVRFKTGKTAGFDFGLKTYLTVSDGTTHESPLFLSATLAKPSEQIAICLGVKSTATIATGQGFTPFRFGKPSISHYFRSC